MEYKDIPNHLAKAISDLERVSMQLSQIGMTLAEGPPTPVELPKISGFKFSAHSMKELEGVHPTLEDIVRSALSLSTQDFMVFDGLRTEAEQRKLVAKGASRTMDSKHLKGLAVDLVPWINGKPTWDHEGCYRIAAAMYQAATKKGLAQKIRWGACWDRTLGTLIPGKTTPEPEDFKKAAQDYTSRRKTAGQSAFIDAVHFEWVD